MNTIRYGLTLVMVLTIGWNAGIAQNTLPDSGRVGIGTLNPNYLLDVAGQAFMDNILVTDRIQTNGELNQYNLVIGQHAQGALVGMVGKGIGFTGLNSDVSYIGTDVRAAINPVLSGGIVTQIGLTFFTHPSSSGSDPLVEAARFDHMGRFMIGTTDSEGYLFNVNGTSQFKEDIRVNGHFGIGKAVDPAVPISINAGSNGIFDDAFEVYDSDDTLRTNLRASGCQFWYLKNTHGEIGQAEICTPDNEPGLTFLDSEGLGKAHIRLLAGGGLVFGAHASGGYPNNNIFMDVDGRLSLGINDSEGYTLNVNGTSQFKDTVVVAGNVGIGTTSPNAKLEVSSEGNSIFRSTNSKNIGGTDWAGTTAHAIDFYNADPSGPGTYASIRVIGNDNSGTPNAGVAEYDLTFFTGGYTTTLAEKMRITNTGNVGIGTSSPETKLAVNGTTQTKEIIVTEQASDWPDYVLDAGYQMRDLTELAAFIQANKHLPGIPTKEEVEREGQNLGAIQVKLLQKIEELTLYTIEQQKLIRQQQQQMKMMARRLDKLETDNE